jgi:hypothetical protein
VLPPLVTRWDLDKTYLRTEFDTLGDLVKTALERPDQKRAVPGAAALLRVLGQSAARVHILSGSPRQLRAKLEEKLRIDRVRWDELTLKPNLSNLLRLRFRALRDQLGYKLPVLLEARRRDQELDPGRSRPREVLVGDDAEADAFVYSLYADVCEGKVDADALGTVLSAGHVYDEVRSHCFELQREIVVGKVVERILIHLDRQSPPSNFDSYGTRVVPFYNYLQAAFVLAEDGRLDGRAVLEVARVLVQRHRFDGEALGRSYLDLLRRGHARGTLLGVLEEGLRVAAKDDSFDTLTLDRLHEMTELVGGYRTDRPATRSTSAPPPDYVELARRHQGGKNRKRFRRLAG